MIETLNRLMKYKSDVQDRLKTLKKEKYRNEISTLTDRPTISPNSKKICSYDISPIYIRSLIEVKAKESRIEKLKQSKAEQDKEIFAKTCTFSPNSTRKSRRKHSDLVDSCLKWKDRKKNQLKICEEDQIQKEVARLRLKPTISENSKKLAEKRSLTPVLERLTCNEGVCGGRRTPSVCEEKKRSNISENSKKILASRFKQRSNKSVSEIRETKGEKLNESFIEFHLLTDFSKNFKINSSRKLANVTEFNIVEFDKVLEILKQSRNK